MKHARKRRWPLVGRILVIVLFWCAAGAAEAYVDSVDFPALRTEPQASVLYYRDGKTILARVGTTDHSDVSATSTPSTSDAARTGSRPRRTPISGYGPTS